MRGHAFHVLLLHALSYAQSVIITSQRVCVATIEIFLLRIAELKLASEAQNFPGGSLPPDPPKYYIGLWRHHLQIACYGPAIWRGQRATKLPGLFHAANLLQVMYMPYMTVSIPDSFVYTCMYMTFQYLTVLCIPVIGYVYDISIRRSFN